MRPTPNEFPVPVPEGWTCETWGPDCLALTIPTKGCVTINFAARCFYGGLTTIGRPASTRKYVGRRWRDRLCDDAIAWLRSIHEKRKR